MRKVSKGIIESGRDEMKEDEINDKLNGVDKCKRKS